MVLLLLQLSPPIRMHYLYHMSPFYMFMMLPTQFKFPLLGPFSHVYFALGPRADGNVRFMAPSLKSVIATLLMLFHWNKWSFNTQRSVSFKGALKARIHISLHESNTLQEQDSALLFLSVIPWEETFVYCHHPAQPLAAACFSIGWQSAPSSVLPAHSSVLITLTTAGVDDSDSQWPRPWLRGGAIP